MKNVCQTFSTQNKIQQFVDFSDPMRLLLYCTIRNIKKKKNIVIKKITHVIIIIFFDLINEIEIARMNESVNINENNEFI